MVRQETTGIAVGSLTGTAKKVLYEPTVTTGEWESKVILSNIRYENDTLPVTIEKFVGVDFKSPVKLHSVWGPFSSTVETLREVDVGGTYTTTVNLNINGGFTFNKQSDTITFEFGGKVDKTYGETYTLLVDKQFPIYGTVKIQCDKAPDPKLEGSNQEVTFTGDQTKLTTVQPGNVTPFQLVAGTYSAKAGELIDKDKTTVASGQCIPDKIDLGVDEEKPLHVQYGIPQKYCALDVTIGSIPELVDVKLHIKVVKDSTLLKDAWILCGSMTPFRYLPQSGILQVVDDGFTINNVKYSFDPKLVTASPSVHQIIFGPGDVKKSPIPTDGFVKPSVQLQTDVTLDATILVRLSSEDIGYTQRVKVKAGTTQFEVPVKKKKYSVQVKGIIQKGTIYATDAPLTLDVVDSHSTLQLKLRTGANLYVPGFPQFLSFGGCTNADPQHKDAFVAARACSIFKYAGPAGDGDPGHYIEDDLATRNTIKLAHSVDEGLPSGSSPVLPVMISYTCSLSGGGVERLKNPDKADELAHGFGNLILALDIARKSRDSKHPVPAGFILNPDLIGECQATITKIPPDADKMTFNHPVAVRKPLNDALKHRRDKDPKISPLPDTVPSNIPDTLRGYVLAVNWLVRTIAPDLPFGWQVNLWGAYNSGALWIYDKDDLSEATANIIAKYLTEIGACDGINGSKPPDFLAIDRYERDDFTEDAFQRSAVYGPREWRRYFNFCEKLSFQMKKPVMPWQIPSSHLPLRTDDVGPSVLSHHWGTGGSYILGDSKVGSNYKEISPEILRLECPWLKDGEKTVEGLFKHAEPFDLTLPGDLDFPQHGIFAMFLGGGQTTGIVKDVGDPSDWARDKLNNYMDNPIPFQ